MLARDLKCSCPANKGKGLRAWFAPTQCSWADWSKRWTMRGFLGPNSEQQVERRLHRGRVWGLCLLWRQRTGPGKVGGEHLILFKAIQSPLAWQRLNLQEGKVNPDPISCRIESTTREYYQQNRHLKFKKTRTGSISTRERQKLTHIELLSKRQNTLVPRVLFHWGQQSREVRKPCSKEEWGPHPATVAHRAAFNIKQERADPFTKIGSSLEADS